MKGYSKSFNDFPCLVAFVKNVKCIKNISKVLEYCFPFGYNINCFTLASFNPICSNNFDLLKVEMFQPA